MIWPSFKEPGYTPFDGQIYATCAQISVESEYSGDLPEGIKIPEGLSKESPGMSTSLAMYRQEVIDEGYVYPGGKLWDGERVVQDGPSFV